MNTPRDPIILLSELLRDTPKENSDKLLSDIKSKISKIDPPTKLYCISGILLSGCQNIRLEINKQSSLSIPKPVEVTKEWDIKINIIAMKKDILVFDLAPPPVPRPGTNIEELSPRIRDMVEDATKQGIQIAEEIESDTEISGTGSMGGGSGISANVAIVSKDKQRIYLDTNKIKQSQNAMTPRLVAITPRFVSSDVSSRVMTANSYQVTKEQIASFWIDDTSALSDKKVDLSSNEVKGYLIDGLRSRYGIPILDSIARVKTVLTCEDRDKMGEYIGTLRLDGNVIRDLKPTRIKEIIKKRLFDEKMVTILDMRELIPFEIKVNGIGSLVVKNIPKPWCITCKIVKLEINSKGEEVLASITTQNTSYYNLNYIDDILGFTDKYTNKELLYVKFVSYESKEILLTVIAELRLYIERHGLRRLKQKEEFVDIPLT